MDSISNRTTDGTRNSPTFFTCRAPEHLPRRPSHPWCSTKPVVQRRSNVQNSEEEERGVAGEWPHRRYSCVTLEPIFEIVASLRTSWTGQAPLWPRSRTPSPIPTSAQPPRTRQLFTVHPRTKHPGGQPPNLLEPRHILRAPRRPRESHYLSVPRRSVLRIARLPRYCAGGVESHATGGPRISVQARRWMPSLGGARAPGKPYPRAPCRAPKEMALRTSTLVVLVFVVSGLLQAQTVIGAACNPPGKPGDASCPSQCKTCTTQ